MPEPPVISSVIQRTNGSTLSTSSGTASSPTRGKSKFADDLRKVINQDSRENRSDTADHILADFLAGCLESLEKAVITRSNFKIPRYCLKCTGTSGTSMRDVWGWKFCPECGKEIGK